MINLICCRLGFLVDFLSHAALVGFMAGAAIMIGLQQLKGLLGISNFTNKSDVVSVLESVYKSLHHQIPSGEVSTFFIFWERNSNIITIVPKYIVIGKISLSVFFVSKLVD